MEKKDMEVIQELWEVIEGRKSKPVTGSYTNKLLNDPDKLMEKLAEELSEIKKAVETGHIGSVDEKDSLVWETSDFLYHLLVLLSSKGVDLGTIMKELKRRRS